MADPELETGHGAAPATQRPDLRLLAECQQQRAPETDDDVRIGAGGSRSFFTSAQWTADGTSVVVGSSDQAVSAFVLPDDLLEDAAGARRLAPQGVTRLPEPSQTVTPAPYFSLQDLTTQSFLAACRDHPIQLYHAFPNADHAPPLCTYKLIKHETEQYITPSSLIWQYPGTSFLCGSVNRLDLFDTSGHASDGPILTIPTTPSKRPISKESGVGMKGTVSALAASPVDSDGGSIIAAGTWTRWVGLYDPYRTDKTIANWSIAQAVDGGSHASIGGQGISQTIWSPCGRYLVINERRSGGLLVYDIRGTGQLLSVLRGRQADTQQRLHCDAFPSGNGGFEVWAGSQDGTMSIWEDVGLHGDWDARPSWDWKAHESPVGSTVIHPTGSVIATCSGGWEHLKTYEDDDTAVFHNANSGTATLDESSLRLWSVSAKQDT